MTVARSERKPGPGATLWSRKGRELGGLLLAVGGLILLVSLLSYDPRDPSWLHQAVDGDGVHNLIGPVGAEVAALGLGLFGLPVLLVPVVMVWAGSRRLFGPDVEPVVGRGLGVVLGLATLPPLFQLVVGSIRLRGDELSSGGAIGSFVADELTQRLGFLGALLVTLGLLAIGVALAIQNSLDDLLRTGAGRVASVWRSGWLGVTRQRERRERERSRRTVVAKHLERARRRRRESGADPAAEVIEPGPLRVRERRGEGGFAIRRVSGAPPALGAHEEPLDLPAQAGAPPATGSGVAPAPAS
ncbi:MAG TPA: DNA translocase FtsK 4TM domain-containing protein, partial [Thermoanaerobaculia bacterium]|nr:DNA translocase FtsK 4TM domain-containing protein [Thermoanaerobaculia bacterium]